MDWGVWCLTDFESSWEKMPKRHVVPTRGGRGNEVLIGTLPNKIISNMVTTRT